MKSEPTLMDIPMHVHDLAIGQQCSLVGSSVAHLAYGMEPNGHDWDIFVPSQFVLGQLVGKAEATGYEIPERDAAVLSRWERFGVGRWHTNSIRMISPQDDEVNVVYKTVSGQPVATLPQVLESFDFGHLAVGYDMYLGTYHDYRRAFFQGWFDKNGIEFNLDGPMPLMPDKHHAWSRGLMSRYNSLREFQRYIKHYDYGFCMELIKPALVSGYAEAARYWGTRSGSPEEEADARQYATVLLAMSEAIDTDNFDQLREADKLLYTTDSLDALMEVLE